MSVAGRSFYTFTASWFHWATAIPLMGAIGTVLKAQQSPKEEKGKWMFRHKSLGLLTGMIIAPRFAYRLVARADYQVRPVIGMKAWESTASSISHFALYGFMAVMPATGIAMGYYGGKGLPFFFTNLPGVVQTDDNKARSGAIAKNAFNVHKQVGVYGKYLVPLHIAGALNHYFAGQTIFTRVNPFRTPRG